MSAAVEVLKGARALIADPERWMQGLYERQGRYCLVGAMRRAAGFDPNGFVSRGRSDELLAYYDARLLFQAFMRDTRGDASGSIVWFNDHSTHEQVIAALDGAIAKAES